MSTQPLDEVFHCDIALCDPATGAAANDDGTPTWAVFEEATDASIQSGNFTSRSIIGAYRMQVTLSAANGFEVGKYYTVRATATVSTVAASAVIASFRLVAAESVAGTPKVDVSHAAGTAWASGAITAASIASNAITSAKLAADCIGASQIAADAIGSSEFSQAAADKVWSTAARALTDKAGFTISGTTTTLDALQTALNAAHGAGSWATATGFSTHSAADVVTAMGTGTFLTAIPWNASWDAEVQSECTDALNAYDPPTNAEMEARTLAAASYATATALADVPTVAEFEARTLVAADYFVVGDYTAPPSAAAVASQVRTELTTELGRMDAAVSTRATPAQVNTEVLDVLNVDTLIDGKTFKEAMRIVAALVAGKVSGAGTSTEIFVGLDGLTTRATVTADASGNRSEVVYG